MSVPVSPTPAPMHVAEDWLCILGWPDDSRPVTDARCPVCRSERREWQDDVEAELTNNCQEPDHVH